MAVSDTSPPWMTLPEALATFAAAGTPISNTTLRRWSNAGHIRTSRTPGGQRRYWRDDVSTVANGGFQPASDAAAAP